jgi:hypothetical protein
LHAQIGINLLFLQDLGWDRQAAATGEAAKRIKKAINRQREAGGDPRMYI